MKKTTRFRAGKKGQHESLLKRISWGPEGPQTLEELEEFNKGPHTIEEHLDSLYSWLNRAMDTCGLPEGTIVTRENATELGPAILSPAIRASYYIRLAARFRKEEKHDSAFNALLFSIPALLNTQILVYEDLILAGKARSDSGNKEKTKQKNELQQLVAPMFYKYLKKGHKRTQASRLTSKWLESEKNIVRSARCIRGWFPEK